MKLRNSSIPSENIQIFIFWFQNRFIRAKVNLSPLPTKTMPRVILFPFSLSPLPNFLSYSKVHFCAAHDSLLFFFLFFGLNSDELKVIHLSWRLIVAGATENGSHVGIIKPPPVVMNGVHRPFHQHGKIILSPDEVGCDRFLERKQRVGQVL